MAGAARPARPAPARLGQHALRSRKLAAALVADARVGVGDLAVDVGAGRGILTAELLTAGAEVWAVESDPRLADALRQRFGGRVRVAAADARELRWPQRPFAVVANLPFAGGGEILRGLLEEPRVPLQRAVVVLQWEVAAKRAAVWPSTLAGVLWGTRFDVRLHRHLAASAFAPPPSVDAGVLLIVRRPAPLVAGDHWSAFRALVRRGFATGRPLRRTVPSRAVKRLAVELGFDPDASARDLDARQWAALFDAVRRPR